MNTVLVYGLKNVQGGIEKYLLSVQAQLQQDVRFRYLIEQGECMHEAIIRQNQGSILYIPKTHPIKTYISSLYKFLAAQRKECGTLYVNVNIISRDMVIILLACFLGYKVVVHNHSAILMETINSLRHRILHKSLIVIDKLILALLPVTRLAVSDKAGKNIYGYRKYRIVPPGIESEDFLFSQEKRNAVRKKYHINGILISFIGRLVTVKNPFFMLDVFAEIHLKQPDARLMILGDGPLRSQMQEYAKHLMLDDALIFVGEVKNPSEYLPAMDMLLCTSLSEGLSLVAIEAQASGLPCLVAEGNYPAMIRITELLEFLPLSAGAEEWSDKAIALASQYPERDRQQWNHEVKLSPFDIAVSAKTLLQYLN